MRDLTDLSKPILWGKSYSKTRNMSTRDKFLFSSNIVQLFGFFSCLFVSKIQIPENVF